MTLSKDKIVYAWAVLVIAGIMFRNTIDLFLGPYLSYVPLLLMAPSVPLYLFWVIKNDITHGQAWLLYYLFYISVLCVISPLLGWFASSTSAAIGFFNLCMPLIFYSTLFAMNKSADFYHRLIKLVFFILVINAFGAYVQYFMSADVFGLIEHNIYTNSDVINQDNVTKRAVSFISSPQSLALAMAAGVALTDFLFSGKRKFIYIFIFLGAGMLTISKVFFVYLFIYFIAAYAAIIYWPKLAVVFSISTFFLLSGAFGGFLERVSKIFYYISNISEYSAYKIWINSLSYVNDITYFLVGRGVGVFSRGAQMILDYKIDTGVERTLTAGSTESYFLQLLIETGILGVSFFILVLVFSIKRLVWLDRKLSSALLAFCCVGLFTPALYGFVSGMLFYLIVAVGLNPKNPLNELNLIVKKKKLQV